MWICIPLEIFRWKDYNNYERWVKYLNENSGYYMGLNIVLLWKCFRPSVNGWSTWLIKTSLSMDAWCWFYGNGMPSIGVSHIPSGFLSLTEIAKNINLKSNPLSASFASWGEWRRHETFLSEHVATPGLSIYDNYKGFIGKVAKI